MVRRVLVVFALVALVASSLACGGEDDDVAAGEPESASTADGSHVALGDTALGPVLVASDGMALYVFTPDGSGPSTCAEECAARWPPLVVDEAPVAGDGVDQGRVGTVGRDDGTDQVTYAGQPLYRYASDSSPGDITGQGVGGTWFLVGADGATVEGQPAPRATIPTPGY